jgi:hypothetical protein
MRKIPDLSKTRQGGVKFLPSVTDKYKEEKVE